MSTPVKELFWLEQEDLDGVDSFFMPADTPPNCPNAFKQRRRMCKEGYERVLYRLVLKQSKEVTDLLAKVSKSVDGNLLPKPRLPPSYHQFVTGQQYVRQNPTVFSEAMSHVMQNADRVEDCTPTDEMELDKDKDTDEEALAYKKNCEDIVNTAVHRLRLKHQVQRSQLLLHATYGLQRVVENQCDVSEKSKVVTTPQQPLTIHSINAKRDPRNRSGYNTASNFSKTHGTTASPSVSPETLYSRPLVPSSLSESSPALVSPMVTTAATSGPPHILTNHPSRKLSLSKHKPYHTSQHNE